MNRFSSLNSSELRILLNALNARLFTFKNESNYSDTREEVEKLQEEILKAFTESIL